MSRHASAKMLRKRSTTGCMYGAVMSTLCCCVLLGVISIVQVEELGDAKVVFFIDVYCLHAVDLKHQRALADAVVTLNEVLPAEQIQARIFLIHRRKVLRAKQDRRIV